LIKGPSGAAAKLPADYATTRFGASDRAYAIDAALLPPGVHPSLAAALPGRPEMAVWGRLLASDARAATLANDTKFAGTIFAPSDAGIAAFLKQDKVSFEAFVGGRHMRYLLFFHSAREPLVAADIAARARAAPIASTLSIAGAAAPIFHDTGGAAGDGGGVAVWGALNVRDRAKVRGERGRGRF